MEILKGIVVKIKDDSYSGIIKCRIDGYFNSETMGNIDEEDLPNLYPLYSQNQNSFYTPKINDEVYVVMDRNNKYSGFWFSKSKLTDYLKDKLSNDYEGFKSIVVDEEEKLEIYYSRSEGVIIKLDKTFININNNQIISTNENRTLHILDDMISLGSLNKSSEPCTLGNKNVDALNEISDQLIDFADKVEKFCLTQKTITSSIAYLAPLNSGYLPLELGAKLIKNIVNNQIKSVTIPKTLSKLTSLD